MIFYEGAGHVCGFFMQKLNSYLFTWLYVLNKNGIKHLNFGFNYSRIFGTVDIFIIF